MVYLYRIVDKEGDTINFHLSETRDHQAALVCIHGVIRIARFIPDKINMKYCNNILEQDHRRVKRITNPMRGFKDVNSANDTIAGIEAITMLRKNQSVVNEINGRVLSIAEEFNLLAIYQGFGR